MKYQDNSKIKQKLSNRYQLSNIKLTKIRKHLFQHCLNHVKKLGCLPRKFSLLSLDAKQELLTIPHHDYHLFLKQSELKRLQKWQQKKAFCNT